MLLAAQVKLRIDATNQVSGNVIVALRAVFEMDREFKEVGVDVDGLDLLDVVDVIIQMVPVFDVTVWTEGKGRDDPKVQIIAQSLVTNHADRKADVPGVADGFHADNPIGVVLRLSWTVHLGYFLGGAVDGLIIVLQGNVVGHVVDTQQKSEMVRRVVVILKIDDFPSLGLRFRDERHREDQEEYYGECFFHDSNFKRINVQVGLFIVRSRAFFEWDCNTKWQRLRITAFL